MVTFRADTLAGFLLGAIMLAGSFLASRAASPPSPGQDSDFTLEGKITDKTGNKLTVSTGENIIFHVVYTDKTDIRKKDGTAGSGADLHTGVTISVAGSLAESGEITANKINIESGA